MKLYKQDTRFTLTRDALRFFFAFNFYVLAKLIGIELEFETEYVVLGSIIIFGPIFCGWACPFGSASYFMTRLGNVLFPKLQFNIPQPYDRWLRLLRYPILVFFLYLFTIKGVNYFEDHMEMYKSNAFSWGYIQLKHVAVIGFALFIPQFFCKYLCFQKAAYNILNTFIPLTKIRRSEDKCIGCKKCDRVCPMQICPSTKSCVSGNDCLGCYNCLDKTCPEKSNALQLTFLGMEVSYVSFSTAVVLVYSAATYVIMFGMPL
ncbi:MAG: 4Fe-4S binding protein [Desulfovibrio sp.]